MIPNTGPVVPSVFSILQPNANRMSQRRSRPRHHCPRSIVLLERKSVWPPQRSHRRQGGSWCGGESGPVVYPSSGAHPSPQARSGRERRAGLRRQRVFAFALVASDVAVRAPAGGGRGWGGDYGARDPRRHRADRSGSPPRGGQGEVVLPVRFLTVPKDRSHGRQRDSSKARNASRDGPYERTGSIVLRRPLHRCPASETQPRRGMRTAPGAAKLRCREGRSFANEHFSDKDTSGLR